MIRVRVIAPSPALRAGLRSLLAIDPEITVVGEQDAWTEAAGRRHDADVIIAASASFEFPDGDVLDESLPAVLILTDRPLDIRRLLGQSMTWGVLALDASATELSVAVHALASGLLVASAQLLTTAGEEPPAHGLLTEREAEVLVLLSKGHANKQIAVALGISEHTVKFHVSSIYAKLNASNRTQAVREGLRHGLIAL